jgi:hypothetical protein
MKELAAGNSQPLHSAFFTLNSSLKKPERDTKAELNPDSESGHRYSRRAKWLAGPKLNE